jgi:lipopolysaccharide transport system permease protein
MIDTTTTRAPDVINIRPSQGLFDLDLKGVWRYRELLAVLVWRDIQILYKQAALGAGWAIIQPLFAVFIFTVVFGMFARMPTDGVPYPVFAFAAVLPWTYFAECVRRASTTLVNDSELVRKVYFPRLVMPLAAVIAPLLDFLIAFVVLMVMMVIYDVSFTWKLLAVFPLILVAGLLALAIGMWLAPINVRFRDVKHTIPFIMQVWMYASPIVYPLSIVPEQYRALYALNPMVGVIEGFRWAVLDHPQPDMFAIGVSLSMIVVALLTGVVFFKKMERSFADLI